jgi:hypothetical protein
MEGVPFCCGFEANTQNPTPKGAPFYIASRYRPFEVTLHFVYQMGVESALADDKSSVVHN